MKELWLSKEDCSGCGMCANICPKNAIMIKEDKCGFYYPVIDKKCIDCDACEKACQSRLNVPIRNSEYPLTYASWSTDNNTRYMSTSGGAFSELVKPILDNGGYVAGAAYNESCSVIHSVISGIDDLSKLRQSKYVQSFSGDIYSQVKKLLAQEKSVVFCGTPCQVAALYAFLKKPYDNLFTIDFICRGVNSPKAYRAWLKELENKYNSRVQRVWFKYKDNGWKASPLCSRIDFENKDEIVLSGSNNRFMYGYLNTNLYIRPSCGKCQFKGSPRLADITLADYWGIEPEYDDDRGTSLIIINSDKGKMLLKMAKSSLVLLERDFLESIRGNPCYYYSVPVAANSEKFLCSLSYKSFSRSLEKYSSDNADYMRNKVNSVLKRVKDKVLFNG